MISRRNVILLTVTGLVAATPAAARAKRSSPVARLDADNDGTIDLAEAKKQPAICSTSSTPTRKAP
jgi:hypothetical protein